MIHSEIEIDKVIFFSMATEPYRVRARHALGQFFLYVLTLTRADGDDGFFEGKDNIPGLLLYVLAQFAEDGYVADVQRQRSRLRQEQEESLHGRVFW